MLKFEYFSPTKIFFGKKTEERTGGLIKEFGGRKVVIIYGGNSVIKTGILKKIEDNLKENDITFISVGGVVPNPLLSKTREILKKALEFNADFVLAVGGGSVLDTAKAVAHGLANKNTDIWEFWAKKATVTKSTGIGAILTISAAGSETSNSSVITNDEINPPTKRGLNTDFNRPKFAIMNPEFTMSLPKWQLGAGVADIFMHTSERFFTNIQGNHLTDEIALGLMRNIIKYGVIGYKTPQDYEAMSEIMWSGSVSHIGLTGLGSKGDTSRDGDWSCHQLGMAISALYDSTHGATLTAVWGTWARYVLDCDIDRFAVYAREVFNLTGTSREIANKGIEKTEEFFKSLGMPLNLTELLGHEPSNDEIENLTRECTYNYTRTIGSLKVLDKEDIKNIYISACSLHI